MAVFKHLPTETEGNHDLFVQDSSFPERNSGTKSLQLEHGALSTCSVLCL